MRKTLSPALHAEWSERLEKQLDELDDLSEKKREIAAALKGELDIVKKGIARTRRVLKGLEGPQIEIPGTEDGERRRDPVIAAILEAAKRVDAAKSALEKAHPGAEVQVRVEGEKPRMSVAGLEALVGTRDAAVTAYEARHGKSPLRWSRNEHDDLDLGVAADGSIYAIRPGAGGRFRWDCGRRRGEWQENAAEARADAERCELERLADERLANAGDGELNARDLKGDAVARKAGK